MSSRSSSESKPGSKRLAAIQSSYIPWKGYFDMIDAADEFVLLDDVQYTRRDWRNRNRIKTSQGTRWLTIPVQVKGRYTQRIDEVEVSDPGWAERHWQTLVGSYSAASFFADYRDRLEEAYLGHELTSLSEINRRLIVEICSLLGIETMISRSSDYKAEGTKTEHLVELCRLAGAGEYLSGPSARDYLDEGRFEQEGMRVRYADYSEYPEYVQLHPPFEHEVTVLDLLVHTGPLARQHMKGDLVVGEVSLAQ